MKPYKIKIEKEQIKSLDLNPYEQYTIENDGFSIAGIEPYKLYAYFSTLVNDTNIVEIGTRAGRSAVAFSYNENNKVISFDILEQGASTIQRKNIEFVIGDFMQSNLDWSKVDIIMIDVDPHDGIKERIFLDFIKNTIKWEGILLLDDILPNWPIFMDGANPVEMNNWWNSLEDEKYDLTDVGHFSGTGLVNIGKKFEIEIC